MDYEQLKARATSALTNKFDAKVSSAFQEYLKEEEIEDAGELVDELRVKMEECSLLDALSDKFQWSATEKARCFVALRITCGLEREALESKESEAASLPLPSAIDWSIPSKAECKRTLDYFNKQCHGAFKDQNAAHMQMATIGRAHGVNLVPLLHDIYSCHKWRHYAKDGGWDKPQFCAQSPFFGAFQNGSSSKRRVYQALLVTLNSIETRMSPKFTVRSTRKIGDDINAFIGYTLCVAEMLNDFVSSTDGCCPLLVRSPRAAAVDWRRPTPQKKGGFLDHSVEGPRCNEPERRRRRGRQRRGQRRRGRRRRRRRTDDRRGYALRAQTVCGQIPNREH